MEPDEELHVSKMWLPEDEDMTNVDEAGNKGQCANNCDYFDTEGT